MAMTFRPNRTIEVYEDDGGKWRWRAIGRNGRVTAVSGESFASKGNARKAADREIRAWSGVVGREVW